MSVIQPLSATVMVLLPLVPLASAVLAPALLRRSPAHAARLSITLTTLTLMLACGLLITHLAAPAGIPAAHGVTGWSMLLDPLSLAMAVAVAAISVVVHVYSQRYMADEPGYVRYYALLDLMTACILMMVAAGDLITLLMAWFLIGVVLYALLGHNTQRPATGRYAFWTFMTYRLGDLPLVGAALILWHAYGCWDLPTLFARIEADPAVMVAGLPATSTAALLVAVAAFARSAQFPLHHWLPYTMDGPTPVSALMHAGIVNAGGFLLNRFAPMLIHTPDVLHLAFAVGLFTALMGSALMLTQNDIKKSLGYSTMGQMGFMIMECGVGAFSLAIYHLIAHGLFKATMFLGAGGVIGRARRDDGVPPDDIYTFVVEHKAARSARLPWTLAAAITVLVPLVMLGASHWIVASDFAHKQGALVLLFFGWVTGAQVFFSIHKLPTERPWRALGMVFLSFLVVVVGYTLIGHGFERFLYPDAAMRDAIYTAAGIDPVAFNLIAALVSLILVGAWLITFYAQGLDLQGRPGSLRHRLYVNLYGPFSREFYLADFLAGSFDRVISGARRVNTWLRWL